MIDDLAAIAGTPPLNISAVTLWACLTLKIGL